MFTIIAVIVLLIVALGMWATGSPESEDAGKEGKSGRTAKLAIIPLLLAVLVLGFGTIYMVPTQQVGIPVTFGKPGPAVGNGIHFKAPWTEVVEMDGTVQIDDNLGDRRTEIRLGNQSVAYVQNSVRWHIKTDAADRLYRDHKSFERIETALEEPELAAALNAAFKDYNPLAAATGDEASLDQISADVQKRLTEKIGDRLVIDSVIIPKVDFDAQTQSRIDAYQTEIGNTRIAEQRKKTATAEAEANKILAQSVSKDPNVLVSKCLDQLSEMVNKGQSVPAGFSCWPGGGVPVIADATSKATAEGGKK